MKRLLPLAGLAGFVVVALGAFGAHGLEGRLSEEAKDWWETATLYGLAHSVAALALALHVRAAKKDAAAKQTPDAKPRRDLLPAAGHAFLIGVLVFSGSLYGLALGAPRWFGMVTPLGGISFLLGWVFIIVQGVRHPRQ